MLIQMIWGIAIISLVIHYAIFMANTEYSNLFRLSLLLLQLLWVFPMLFVPKLHNNLLFFYLLPSVVLLLPWLLIKIQNHRMR